MVSIIVVTFKNTVVYLDHVMMDYGGGLLNLAAHFSKNKEFVSCTERMSKQPSKMHYYLNIDQGSTLKTVQYN